MDFDRGAVVERFLKKCEKDLELIAQEVGVAIIKNYKDNIAFYCYKYTLCEEIYDMFKRLRGGVGYFAKYYGALENPLMQVFSDTITYFTEPKLVTENKLYKVVDKLMEKEGNNE